MLARPFGAAEQSVAIMQRSFSGAARGRWRMEIGHGEYKAVRRPGINGPTFSSDLNYLICSQLLERRGRPLRHR
jgi:hypothetical protein